MKNFVVHNEKGKILRTGNCSDLSFLKQAGDNEFVIEGTANDVTQKIVNGKVVDKTPEEIEVDNPTSAPIPFEKQPAQITNKQWQDILDRLDKLEK